MNQSLWQLPESFFDELSEQNWAVADQALEPCAAAEILKFSRSERLNLTPAGIGRKIQNTDSLINESIRTDSIYWITPADQAWSLIDDLKTILASQMRIGLLDFEAHFARYNPGGKYEMHLDQFSTSSQRALTPVRTFSFILYLNPAWKQGDGGELAIYDENKIFQKNVEPVFNRLIVFRSDLIPHEVTVTQATRYSLTGWMRK